MSSQPQTKANQAYKHMIDTDDTQPIYERLEREPSAAYAKFLIYRGMKPTVRSLVGAYNLYQAQKSPKKPVKTAPGSWKDMCARWDWKFRAEQWDAKLQAEQEARDAALREAEAAEIERIMTTGYAAKHKRVEGLATMAHKVENSMLDPITGEVNPKWVDPEKVREYRGCLTDIAAELGDRVKKQEHTGKDGGPIEFITEWGGGVIEENEDAA